MVVDTPFTAVKIDNKWFLTFGKYRVTEEYDDLQTLLDTIKQVNWKVIATICSIMYEEFTKLNLEKK